MENIDEEFKKNNDKNIFSKEITVIRYTNENVPEGVIFIDTPGFENQQIEKDDETGNCINETIDNALKAYPKACIIMIADGAILPRNYSSFYSDLITKYSLNNSNSIVVVSKGDDILKENNFDSV